MMTMTTWSVLFLNLQQDVLQHCLNSDCEKGHGFDLTVNMQVNALEPGSDDWRDMNQS